MFHGSHETYVDSLKRHMKAWKMRGPAGDGSRGAFSDATICDFIVETHNRIDGPSKTGIVFAPGSSDEFNRKKANAVRIMRMLTDEPQSEHDEIQLFNMAPSILAAMPQDLAVSFITEYLRPAKLLVRAQDDEAHAEFNLAVVHDTHNAAHDAMKSMLEATLNPTPENLEIAEREAIKATEKFKRTRAFISAARNGLKAIGRIVQRKNAAPIPGDIPTINH
jgi:hypothetical protein